MTTLMLIFLAYIFIWISIGFTTIAAENWRVDKLMLISGIVWFIMTLLIPIVAKFCGLM